MGGLSPTKTGNLGHLSCKFLQKKSIRVSVYSSWSYAFINSPAFHFISLIYYCFFFFCFVSSVLLLVKIAVCVCLGGPWGFSEWCLIV